MGLAASQARYLALTARKGDLEFQSQTINTRRLQLAYKTAEIAKAYSDGMQNQRIEISHLKTSTEGKTEQVWEELSFKNLYEQGFMIIGTNGAGLNSTPPYQQTTSQTSVYYDPSAAGTITAKEYDTVYPEGKDDPNAAAYVVAEYETNSEGKQIPKTYKLNPKLTETEYDKLDAEHKLLFVKMERQAYNYEPTATYGSSSNDMDIQALLVSGTGHIVTKAFFDYLVSGYGYNYTDGISPAAYSAALDEWGREDSTINPAGSPSVIDWRSDVTDTFEQRNYTEDDEEVLAKYEADTAKIQAQDKMLEIEEKNIETQHKAIETELESIQKVIQNNIDKTFKIFS